MDKSIVDKKARAINIKASTKREFFLLHGYTGSPTDFNLLGKYLNKRFNANVKIIRLRGHGERIENLKGLRYKDFLFQSEKELKKEIDRGMEIILGGISMGSFMALQLASKYPIKGVVNISASFKNKFFTGVIAFFEPLILKKHWKKKFSDSEKKFRENGFFYDTDIKGLKILKQAKKELKKVWRKITVPSLIIHSAEDKVFHPRSAKIISRNINSKINEIFIFNELNAGHNPFYSSNHEKLYKIIGDFVEKNKLFGK